MSDHDVDEAFDKRKCAMSIEVRNVSKVFGGFAALRDFSLHVGTGEMMALLGPSGCGKTTLLRIIAGLEVPDTGSVLFHGKDATDRSVRDRRVGFVFQHYALFRHMTVFENIAFGLQVRPRRERPSRAEIRRRVFELLRLVQLEWLAEHYPAQLSGGQRQRIALARALAVEPKVLLLDEPFGALDARVRKELRRWLRRLHETIHVTSVFVTHDQEEALELADRVVVMNEGRVEQVGTPDRVYDQPANPFVYNFLGDVNLFRGRVHQGQAQIGDMEVAVPDHSDVCDAEAIGFARPYDLDVQRERSSAPCIAANVCHIQTFGRAVRLELRRHDTNEPIEAELTKERFQQLGLHAGETVYVTLRKLRFFVQASKACAVLL